MKKNTFKRLHIPLLLFLFGGAVFFSYHLANNKSNSSADNRNRSTNISKTKGTKTSSHNYHLKKQQSRKKRTPSFPKTRDHFSFPFHGAYPNQGKTPDYEHSRLEISLADIAYYDPFQNGYILKEINLFTRHEEIGGDVLSALKILNRKNMPPDYYRRQEYESAYNEISNFYPDTYIWPYFSNMAAKKNFFLFLFTRYAADNKTWRPYERDVSDCSQFSQRIYLLLYPGEVCMEDEKYFHFLFSDRKNREERKKLCNKIPNIYYTIATPYLLKKESPEPPPSSHAMIAFTPDNNLEKLILGEPQTGECESIGENISTIMDVQLTRYPLMCNLGKIVTISKDSRHEAEIEIRGSYFLPKALLNGSGYNVEDPRRDYEDEPILLEARAYSLCRVVSSYIERAINYQPINHWGFLGSVDDLTGYGNISLLQMESFIGSSADIIMHGLMDLDNSDLRRVREEMDDLKNLVDEQPDLSPHIEKLATELTYLFQLKLKHFLE